MPFRSVALYRWADEVDDAHVLRLGAALDDLTASVPEIRSVAHGSDTGATGGEYDYVVVIDVATGDAWRAVRDHPAYVLMVEELVTNHVADRATAQFRVEHDASPPGEAAIAELTDDELMARARRAAQASMDALMAEPDDV